MKYSDLFSFSPYSSCPDDDKFTAGFDLSANSSSNMNSQMKEPLKDLPKQEDNPIPGPTPIPPFQQGPPPVTQIDYIPGYLASNIGRNIKAEFIVGTSQYVEKVGKLVDVGINYFVLQDINSRTYIMCDLYSVRFVTILYD